MGAALTVYQLFYESAKDDAATQAPDNDGEKATTSSDFKRDRVPTTLLQNETLVDVFAHLSRDDIDLIRFGSRRLRQLIDDCMATVCLRYIVDARIAGNSRKDASSFDVTVTRKLLKDKDSDKKDTAKDDDSANAPDSPKITRCNSEEKVEQTFKDLFDAAHFLLTRLKSSVVVGDFTVYRLALSCDFCAKVAEMGSSVFLNELYVDSVNASPETLRRFVARCFAEVRSAQISSYNGLYPSDVCDELLRECAASGVYKLVLDSQEPKHADRFLLSDDGILDFIFGHKEDKPKELKAFSVVVSPQFFDRLVQANKKSKLTAKMRIKVKLVRDPLFDTSNYERHRKQFGTMQVFDFPGDVRFQIMLYPHNAHQNPQEWTIDLRRCKEPTDGTRLFY